VIDEERRWILRELRRRARPALSPWLKGYLGSPLPTLAVSAPDLHRLVREFRRRYGARSSSQILPVLRALWAGRTYDERIVAIELLAAYLDVRDAMTWRLASKWVDRATGWALSDSLASGPVARMVADDPGRFSDLLRWTRSRNLWRRRAAAYALHDLVFRGDVARALSLLERLILDPELWVQRAVGTWLRECWKRDPHRTDRFLRRHVGSLAPVTITVATERAPAAYRAQLRALHRVRRGHAHIPRAR
jgi:3-methyladenine DNA glycosylase AlkD